MTRACGTFSLEYGSVEPPKMVFGMSVLRGVWRDAYRMLFGMNHSFFDNDLEWRHASGRRLSGNMDGKIRDRLGRRAKANARRGHFRRCACLEEGMVSMSAYAALSHVAGTQCSTLKRSCHAGVPLVVSSPAALLCGTPVWTQFVP